MDKLVYHFQPSSDINEGDFIGGEYVSEPTKDSLEVSIDRDIAERLLFIHQKDDSSLKTQICQTYISGNHEPYYIMWGNGSEYDASIYKIEGLLDKLHSLKVVGKQAMYSWEESPTTPPFAYDHDNGFDLHYILLRKVMSMGGVIRDLDISELAKLYKTESFFYPPTPIPISEIINIDPDNTHFMKKFSEISLPELLKNDYMCKTKDGVLYFNDYHLTGMMCLINGYKTIDTRGWNKC